MDLVLKRTEASEYGIFSELLAPQGTVLFQCAEHAYHQPDGSWAPKLSLGQYKCVIGEHILDHSPRPFLAFEVQGVPGHTGILFHIGNWPQKDSDGCVLLGETRQGNMIYQSEEAFESFMAMQCEDPFTLLVIEE